ncbi:MAG TPA: FHA domain-containing protein, partial [Pirellulales bacterium]
MADLIAQGARSQNRWRRTLVPGEEVVVGRAADTWSAFWDEKISRRHAKIRLLRNVLSVERLPGSRNPIFFHGHEAAKFDVRPNESFVIGDTMFTLAAEDVRVSDGPAPVEELTFAARDLQHVRYRDADHRLDVLSRLPDVISGAT